MDTFKKKTATFNATSDDGRQFTIDVFTEFHETNTNAGRRVVEANKTFKTTDGMDVSPKGKGTYEIVDLDGLVVQSQDPAAP
jgi:hypothetical protein